MNTGKEKTHIIEKYGFRAEIYARSGGIKEIAYRDIILNSCFSSPQEESFINFYLRRRSSDRVEEILPLLGQKVNRIAFGESDIIWEGSSIQKGKKGEAEIKWSLRLCFCEGGVFFGEPTLEPDPADFPDSRWDIVSVFDKSLLPRESVSSVNEIFNSHYTDARILSHPLPGSFLRTHHNLSFSSKNLRLYEGCISWEGAKCESLVEGLLTDGEEFFGASYPENSFPEALLKTSWGCPEVVQRQMALTALKTKSFSSREIGEKKPVFFSFLSSGDEERPDPEFLRKQYEKSRPKAEASYDLHPLSFKPFYQRFLHGETPNSALLDELYPERKYEEKDEKGRLLSFYTGTNTHVVLKEKEIRSSQKQAHILRNGKGFLPTKGMISFNALMGGCFMNQLAAGNTTFNTGIPVSRGFLNLIEFTGVRLLEESGGKTGLYSLPSLWEACFDFARWIYAKDGKQETEVLVRINSEGVAELKVSAPAGKKLFLLIRLSEGAEIKRISERKARLSLSSALSGKEVHRLAIESDSDFAFAESPCREKGADRDPGEGSDRRDSVYLRLSAPEQTLRFCRLETPEEAPASEEAGSILGDLPRPFLLEGEAPETDKIQSIGDWFSHNALVHLSVLHGVEQWNGAAWGVRDILQGSLEYLFSAGTETARTAAREILLRVFANQYEEGDWPQWFMSDDYEEIRDAHSHGDTIIWPLKGLAEYLEETNDRTILEESCSFYSREKKARTEKAGIRVHLRRQLDKIRSMILPGTPFLSYGEGDWNDSLQPVNDELRKRLVSPWTVLLAAQYTLRLAELLVSFDRELADSLRETGTLFREGVRDLVRRYRYLPGFLRVSESGEYELFFHEQGSSALDGRYRLLPMQRFVLSGLGGKEEAELHTDLIKKHLLFPDGLHLLDKPLPYNRDQPVFFKRAEQSAFFGREVGLMYTHAHLRGIEAFLLTGDGDTALSLLEQIIPLEIRKVIPKAGRRQANAYFSSSDLSYRRRSEICTEKYSARTVEDSSLEGRELSYEGGWRIYSSGPGIFLSLVKRFFFGLRGEEDFVVFDPVFPSSWGRIRMKTHFRNMPLTITYHPGPEGKGVKKITVNGEDAPAVKAENPYRRAGIKVRFDYFRGRKNPEIRIETY